MPAMAMMSPAEASVDLDALEAVEGVDLGDARVFDDAVAVDDLHRRAEADGAAGDAADAEAAEVVVVVDGRDQHLERRFGVAGRRRYGLEDGVEQRLQGGALVLEVAHGDALRGDGEQGREVELLVVGAEAT